MRKINIPKGLLYGMYVNKEMTTYQIANELGTSRQTINNKLKGYGIEIRNSLFQPKPKVKRIVVKKNPAKDYKNKETFQKVYSELKSINLVAEYFKVNIDTAYNWKVNHEIETIKRFSESGIKRINQGKPYCDKENLQAMYDKYSTRELAKMWNCHPSTLSKWLKHFGIPTKSSREQWKRKPKSVSGIVQVTHEAFDLQVYKNHYKIHGNLSKKVVKSIKELVGECQSCGEGEVLDLHHIDENHLNNLPENHVILCPNCHARIHRLGKTVSELCPNFKDWSKLIKTYADAK